MGDIVKDQKKVDKYGDPIPSINLQGDHWGHHHDQIKHFIGRLCVRAGVPCELEVFNMVSGLIPQTGLARIDKVRQLQSTVPDMKISGSD